MRRSFLRAALTVGAALALLWGVGTEVLLVLRDHHWTHELGESEADGLAAVLALTDDPQVIRAQLGRTTAGREGRLAVEVGGRTYGTVRGAGPDDPLLRRVVPAAGGANATLLLRAPEGGLATDGLLVGAAAAAAGLAITAAGTWYAARRIRPVARDLDALTTWIDAPQGTRAPPLSTLHHPEILRLRAALGRMERQVEQARAAERRVMEDLSHRLRTPLTALFLDVDGIGDTPEARRIRDVVHTLDAAVSALIRTSSSREREVGRCDLVEVVRTRMRFWSGLAEHSGRPVRSALTATPAPVAVAKDAMAAVLDAVVGNVFTHTASGTGFLVMVVVHDGWATLVVDDAGRGIPDPAAALRRGSSGAGSTGLGLAIARDTVEVTGGTIHLERSSLEGARVRLRFALTP